MDDCDIEELMTEIQNVDLNKVMKDYEIIDNTNLLNSDEFLDFNIINESLIVNDHNINPIYENKIILFDIHKYLFKIALSYKFKSDKIIEQFNRDVSRSTLI